MTWLRQGLLLCVWRMATGNTSSWLIRVVSVTKGGHQKGQGHSVTIEL